MKLNLVRFAALAALTVSTSAAFASPIIPMPNPTKGFAASRVQGGFSPIIPMPNPTKGFAASRVQGGFSPIIPMPNPTKG